MRVPRGLRAPMQDGGAVEVGPGPGLVEGHRVSKYVTVVRFSRTQLARNHRTNEPSSERAYSVPVVVSGVYP